MHFLTVDTWIVACPHHHLMEHRHIYSAVVLQDANTHPICVLFLWKEIEFLGNMTEIGLGEARD